MYMSQNASCTLGIFVQHLCMYLWLHVYCNFGYVKLHTVCGLCVGRKGGTRRGEWGHLKVLCTWQLLGLAVKGPWLALAHLGCMNRLRDATLSLWGSFLAGKAVCVLNGPRMLIIAWIVNEWVWLKSRVCLLWLEVHFVLVRAQTEIKFGARKERHAYMLSQVKGLKYLLT